MTATGDVSRAPQSPADAPALTKRPKLRRSGVEPYRQAAVTRRAAQTPERMRKLYLRVAAGTASVRGAVKSFCFECNGDDRQAVTDCGNLACPLWTYRPWQRRNRAAATPATVDSA
jgi:hypothetical protein